MCMTVHTTVYTCSIVCFFIFEIILFAARLFHVPFSVVFSKDQRWLVSTLFFFSVSLYCIVIVSILSLSLHEGCSLYITAKFHFNFKKNQGTS